MTKKCSFAGKNRSFIASFITTKLFDDGCFDFGSFSQKVIIALTFGQILSNRSAVTLFSTNLDQKYFKLESVRVFHSMLAAYAISGSTL